MNWEKVISRGVPAVSAVIALIAIFYYVISGLGQAADDKWYGLGMLALAVVIASAIGAFLRVILDPGDLLKDWNKDDTAKLIVGGVAAVFALAMLSVLVYYVIWRGESGQPLDRWQGLALVAFAVVIAAGVGALLRFVLSPLLSQVAPAVSTDATTALRSRIAPMVFQYGSVAIAALTTVLIAAYVVLTFANKGNVGDKVDTLLSETFAMVLPLIATWVGTVLAFYFGTENYKQAAESTREAIGGRLAPAKKVSDVMTPYDRIARLEVDGEAKDVADNTPLSKVLSLMSQAATRVIVFNKTAKKPYYIIKGWPPFMDENWIDKDYTPRADADIKIKQYLDRKGNLADAEKLRFIKADATIEDAFDKIMTEKVDDLFVTADGNENSPVLGWLTTRDVRKLLTDKAPPPGS